MTRPPAPAAAWPFVPFERYMLDDDRPGVSMTYTVAWRLRGRVDVTRMRDAVARAVGSHPLLACRAGRRGWVPAAGGVPFRRVASLAALAPDWESLDPERDACLRAALVGPADGAADSELRLTFHHAACDGVGAMEFSGDLFAAYRGDGGATDTTVTTGSGSPADPGLLSDRGRLDRPFVPGATWRDAAAHFLGEGRRFLTERAVAIPCTAGGPAPAPGPLPGIRFDTDDTATLRGLASGLGATLNELLLAMLIEAIGRHCATVGAARRGAWVGVVQPVSMRPPRPTRMPAVNAIGYAFLRRPLAECHDWRRLLPGVVQEQRAVTSLGLAGCFNDAIALLGRLPPVLRRALVRSMRPGTFVFSYLGDPIRRFSRRLPQDATGVDLGGCHVVGFAAAPPTRPGTELAVLGCVVDQRLTLWLRPSPRLAATPGFHTLVAAIDRTVREGLGTQLPAAPASAPGPAARTAW